MASIIYKINPYRLAFNRRIKKLALKVKAGAKVLEIGGGPISYRKYFKQADFLCTDVKKSQGVDRIEDVTKMNLKDNSFDVVLCFNVLEHLTEPEKAISELHRVLKKGGTAIISTPFLYPLHDEPNDYQRFTSFWFQKKLKAFSEINISKILLAPALFPIMKKLVIYYIVVATK